MRRSLRKDGFDVAVAADGEDGSEMATRVKPGRDHARCDDAADGRLGVLTTLKADPATGRHSGHHADHGGRQENGLRARRGGIF